MINIAVLIFGESTLLLISCNSKTHSEVELFGFKVKSGNLLELYKQDNFIESENWDIVKNLTVSQIEDTTVYHFEIFEGLCEHKRGKSIPNWKIKILIKATIIGNIRFTAILKTY